MIEIIVSMIIGLILGILTGITPGLHVNTIGLIIFSLSDSILKFISPLALCSFFVSVSLTHAMMEFIPSLLIGLPDEDTILSIQPGHRLIFKSKGRKAIRLVSFGGFLSIITLIILMPSLMMFLPLIYNFLKDYIGFLLVICMIILLVYFNKRGKRLISILFFIVSGILGITVLNSSLGSNLGLLSILSGLFSISSLIYSYDKESAIPPQDDNTSFIIDGKFRKSVFAGSISGCVLGLLPGLGPAQGTIIAQSLIFNKNISSEEFLITNSGVNISDTLFSLIAIYLISNPRSAISVYISNIISDITLNHVIFFIFVSLFSVSLACVLSIKIGDFVIDNIQKIEYKKLNLGIIILVTLIIFAITVTSNGCLWYVVLCYVTSTSIGLVVNYLDVSKSNLMGVLIIPSIITYLGIG